LSQEKPDKPVKEKKEKSPIKLPSVKIGTEILQEEIKKALRNGEPLTEYYHEQTGNTYHILESSRGFIPVEFAFGSARPSWEIPQNLPAARKSLANYANQLIPPDPNNPTKKSQYNPSTKPFTLDEIKLLAGSQPAESPATAPAPEGAPIQSVPVMPRPFSPLAGTSEELEPPKEEMASEVMNIGEEPPALKPLTIPEWEEIENLPTPSSEFTTSWGKEEKAVLKRKRELRHAEKIQKILEKRGAVDYNNNDTLRKKDLDRIIKLERERARHVPPRPDEEYRKHEDFGGLNEEETFDYLLYAKKQNILLPGPTSVGKTMFVDSYCFKHHLPLTKVSCVKENTNLVGLMGIDRVKGLTAPITKWHDGPLTIAMKRGYILFLDELNAIPPEEQIYLTNALQYRQIRLPNEENEEVIADPRFRIIGAYNPDYKGINDFNEAIYNRFQSGMLIFTSLPAAEEVDRFEKLLHKENPDVPVTDEFKRLLITVIDSLRVFGMKEIHVPFATSRAITALAYQLAAFVEVRRALPTTEQLKYILQQALTGVEKIEDRERVETEISRDFQNIDLNYFGNLPTYEDFAAVMDMARTDPALLTEKGVIAKMAELHPEYIEKWWIADLKHHWLTDWGKKYFASEQQ
jgi:MoxR-like ATPase